MHAKTAKHTGSIRKSVVIAAPQSIGAEEFRRLRTNIGFLVEQNMKTIVITSAIANEGKSWIAANLAVMYAREGKKTLLVDCDMRMPSVQKTFGIFNELGISNVLAGLVNPEAAIQKSFIDYLYLLPSGPVPSNSSEMLTSKSMDSFLDYVKQNFDIILFDTPPLLSVVDGQILANRCEGSILVVNSGKTDRQKAMKAKEMIVLSKGTLIGVVLNSCKSSYKNRWKNITKNKKL